MADVLFVRHGETDWNEEDKLRGWSPIPLNEDGRKEAQQAAQFLSQYQINHITAADLPRVVQTAYPIQRSTRAPLTLDRRYRDMDYGDWTGVQVTKVLPQLVQMFKDQEGTPPGSSESYEEMKSRLLQAMAGLLTTAQQVSGGSYIVVSSNRVARTLLSAITNNLKFELTPDDPIPNGGLLRFAQEKGLEGYGVGQEPFKYWGWQPIQATGVKKPGFNFKEE